MYLIGSIPHALGCLPVSREARRLYYTPPESETAVGNTDQEAAQVALWSPQGRVLPTFMNSPGPGL